jgi:hypothetical protein
MIDDFFLMAPTQSLCSKHLRALLGICNNLGVPISQEKTTSPSTNTTFFGIELDTRAQCAILPQDKLLDYAVCISQLMERNKVRKRCLESVIGKLNFAASVVPARPFLRRMIDQLSQGSKPFHYIRITRPVREDLGFWLHFLQEYNGVTYFRALNLAQSDVIHMASDASKAGFGAVYGKRWLQAPYPPPWQNFNITVLELYPIFVLVCIFGPLLQNSNILFHCDNEAVVAIINKQSSKDSTVMCIMRPLVLKLVQHNIGLKSVHIPGMDNILPDKISRFQVTPALLEYYAMQNDPTPIPLELLPANFTIN